MTSNKETAINTKYHIDDLPSNVSLQGNLAIDTEAMGLNNFRDRLCVVQLSDEAKNVHVVHFPNKQYDCPNLKKFLNDESRIKIFHFARFDIAIMHHYLKVELKNVYCTKVASRLARTYTDQHSLKDLCHELLGVKISKQQQTSDWGAAKLTQDQINYAASDVLYLHALKDKLDFMLKREGRLELAGKCFEFLPTRADLDLSGWPEIDIFAHSI
ncbi:ribonuclease D [endosymbiont of Acanthamoeba sp. UWC8]|nr:ribonuclease H-like domain-containing protein [endosymbiont of Acanthamoeba sp. UWC8]AIF81076.1 ribonuclease D [endosymbiont of Acanthamoeba sp. UWC8]